MSVKLTTRQIGDVTVIDAAGRITLGEGSSTFRDSIKELTTKGHKKVLLNLGEVSYIDSSGIGELVSGFTTVSNAGGQLKLLKLTKRIQDLLQITKLYTIFEVFDDEARRHGVFPLRDAGSPRNGEYSVPHVLGGTKRMTYTTAHVRMPESSVLSLKNCSWRIVAEIVIPDRVDAPRAVGVIACQGGNMSGWSMWLDEGSPCFTYNCFGHDITTLRGAALPPGRHEVEATLEYDGGFGAGGGLVLVVDGVELDRQRIERTVPVVFSMSGETFDVGVDTGSPVGPYPHQFACTVPIVGVTLERLDEPPRAVRDAEAEGRFRAGMSTQ